MLMRLLKRKKKRKEELFYLKKQKNEPTKSSYSAFFVYYRYELLYLDTLAVRYMGKLLVDYVRRVGDYVSYFTSFRERMTKMIKRLKNLFKKKEKHIASVVFDKNKGILIDCNIYSKEERKRKLDRDLYQKCIEKLQNDWIEEGNSSKYLRENYDYPKD